MHVTTPSVRPGEGGRALWPARRLLWILAAAACAPAAAQPDDAATLPVDAAPTSAAVLDARSPNAGSSDDGVAASARDLPAAEISTKDVETFAQICVELERQARRYERSIAQAESDEEAQEIQARLQRESLEVLDEHGWTAERFDRVARALNTRPDLAAEALRRIEEED